MTRTALWLVLVPLGLLTAGVGSARAQSFEHCEGSVCFAFWNESGDDTIVEGWGRLRDNRRDIEAWARLRADLVSGDWEASDPQFETPELGGWGSYLDGESGAYPPRWHGVECWDTPAINEKFGERLRDQFRNFFIAGFARVFAPACFETGACGVAFMYGFAGAGTGWMLWEAGTFIWDCYR
jgi:hypothetical protein